VIYVRRSLEDTLNMNMNMNMNMNYDMTLHKFASLSLSQKSQVLGKKYIEHRVYVCFTFLCNVHSKEFSLW
jgi:hypothetical protein